MLEMIAAARVNFPESNHAASAISTMENMMRKMLAGMIAFMNVGIKPDQFSGWMNEEIAA